jgi:vesicular inhibitory amino acid transporter
MDLEDWKAGLVMFCATFGIGSLGMGYSFASSGPIIGSLALYFISACNLHSSMVLSKCLSASPSHVETFGDLGEHLFGSIGRHLINTTQLLTCLLTPIGFLVIGGNDLLPALLSGAFPSIFPTQWILAMALLILPLTFLSTTRETLFLCIAGGFSALLADGVAVYVNLSQTDFRPRQTELSLPNSLQIYGSMCFAFGTAVLVPTLQRDHSRPTRLPRVISNTLLVITALYALLGMLTYVQFGCTAPSNLLEQLSEGPFQQVAYAGMLLHLIVAFVMILNPALFVLERWLLGGPPDAPPQSYKSLEVSEREPLEGGGSREVNRVGRSLRGRLQSLLLRGGVVGTQTFLAMMLQASLRDVLNLIGATTVTLSCVIAPCMCGLKMFGGEGSSRWERGVSVVVIGSSLVLAGYATGQALREIWENAERYELFRPIQIQDPMQNNSRDSFPFCQAGERN